METLGPGATFSQAVAFEFTAMAYFDIGTEGAADVFSMSLGDLAQGLSLSLGSGPIQLPSPAGQPVNVSTNSSADVFLHLRETYEGETLTHVALESGDVSYLPASGDEYVLLAAKETVGGSSGVPALLSELVNTGATSYSVPTWYDTAEPGSSPFSLIVHDGGGAGVERWDARDMAVRVEIIPPAPVPLPASAWLGAAAMAALGGLRLRAGQI